MLLIKPDDHLRASGVGDLGRNKLTVVAVPPLDQKLETSVRVRSANDRLGLQAFVKPIGIIDGISGVACRLIVSAVLSGAANTVPSDQTLLQLASPLLLIFLLELGFKLFDHVIAQICQRLPRTFRTMNRVRFVLVICFQL